MQERYLRRPSCVAGYVVGLTGSDLCFEASGPVGVDAGAATVIDALGHPDRPIVATVEMVQGTGVTQVRVVPLDSREPAAVVHSYFGPVTLVGWWDAETLAVASCAPDDVQPSPVTMLSIVAGKTAPSEPILFGVDRLDHAGDGRIVLVTSGPRPGHWRGYRGGGTGRILVLDPSTRAIRELPGTGNAADAVVLGARVYWLDDLVGEAVDVYSVALDATPQDLPTRHSDFKGIGATSLRRGVDRLVVGALGKVWTLKPGEVAQNDDWRGVMLQRWDGHHRDDKGITEQGPLPVERVITDMGGRVAVVAEGAVRCLGRLEDDWVFADSGGGWTADAAWDEDGVLRTLEHHDGGTVVRARGADGEELILPLGPESDAAEWLAHRGGTSIVAGESCGVAAISSLSCVQWLTRAGAYRRSRPTVAHDGSRVAWSQDNDLQGGRIVVHDLEEEVSAELVVPGMHLWSPVFASGGELMFLARSVSFLGGTAAPMEKGTVCSVPTKSLNEVHQGAVTVVHQADMPLHELAFHEDVAWVRAGDGRWNSLEKAARVLSADSGATPVPGSDLPVLMTRCGELMMPQGVVEAGLRSGVWGQRNPVAVVAEVIRRVRRVAKSIGESPVDLGRAAERDLLESARCADSPQDLAEVLDAAVGQVGLSHASVLRPSRQVAGSGIAGSLIARAEEQLEEYARYLPLHDVSVQGWTAVQNLMRTWRGNGPLVIDLRFNEGGQFADAILGQLRGFLLRSATAITAEGFGRKLLSRPSQTLVLIGEYTGSGGEHLAAGLRQIHGVSLWGRRTAGAGTGFHRTYPLIHDLRLALPQYRLGGQGRECIENHGVVPDLVVAADHTAGAGLDDLLLTRVQNHLARCDDIRPHSR